MAGFQTVSHLSPDFFSSAETVYFHSSAPIFQRVVERDRGRVGLQCQLAGSALHGLAGSSALKISLSWSLAAPESFPSKATDPTSSADTAVASCLAAPSRAGTAVVAGHQRGAKNKTHKGQ